MTAFRLTLSIVLFLAALLTVFHAPANILWKLSIIVLEAGYFLVLPCLLLALFVFARWGGSRSALTTIFLLLVSAFLFAIPLMRTFGAAHRLEKNFAAGPWNGHSAKEAFKRPEILSWKDLLVGIKFAQVEPKTLVYARHDTESLSLDFYPTQRKQAPCVIVVHGGGWDNDDRKELPALNSYLASLGYAVAAIDYRLAPEYRYPAPVEDVSDALNFLRGHAEELGIDSSRLVLLGRSAGGQIALQAAYTLKDAAVKGVVSFYAPADMVWGYSIPTSPLIMNSRKLLEQYLGGGEPQVPEAYRAASPLVSIDSAAPPSLFLQGGMDVIVSPLHVVHLKVKMDTLGTPQFTVDLPWTTHAYDYVFSGPGSQISLYFLERFLAQVTQ